MNRTFKCFAYFCIGVVLTARMTAYAQIDPESRQLLHVGVNQSLHNDGPQAHYLFFYWNMPDYPSTNQALRLIIAPTYVDGELGLKNLLGDNTDLGLGLFGGGFANSYDEVRQGKYFRNESFDGHGGGASISVYHLFNPQATVPLNGLVRATVDYRDFESSDDTAGNFVLPKRTSRLSLYAPVFDMAVMNRFSCRGSPLKFPPGTNWSTEPRLENTALARTDDWRQPPTAFGGVRS